MRVVADGVEQVGLAEPGVAVDEERVVRLRRRLGDGDRGGMGEAVGLADDEVVERVLRVQARVAARERRMRHRASLAIGWRMARRGRRRCDCTGIGAVRWLSASSGFTTTRNVVARRLRLLVDPRERLHDRRAHALVDLRGGQVVRNVEVEGSAHDALGNGEVQEALQLRSDAVVVGELVEHGRPDRNIWNFVR